MRFIVHTALLLFVLVQPTHAQQQDAAEPRFAGSLRSDFPAVEGFDLFGEQRVELYPSTFADDQTFGATSGIPISHWEIRENSVDCEPECVVEQIDWTMNGMFHPSFRLIFRDVDGDPYRVWGPAFVIDFHEVDTGQPGIVAIIELRGTSYHLFQRSQDWLELRPLRIVCPEHTDVEFHEQPIGQTIGIYLPQPRCEVGNTDGLMAVIRASAAAAENYEPGRIWVWNPPQTEESGSE